MKTHTTTRSTPAPRALAMLAPIVAVLAGPLVAAPALASEGGGDPVMELIYQAINLVLIVGIIVYFARKPITQYLADRRGQISSDLDTAAQLLSDAEARNSELQRRLVELQSEVEEIRESARRRAEEESERIIAEANKTAERIRNDATAAVGQELQRAQRELRTEASELALELAGKILQESVNDSDRERLLDEFITRVEPGPEASGQH